MNLTTTQTTKTLKNNLLFVFLLFSALLSAQTIKYVATTGSDSSGDGTVSLPFLTIQAAINDLGTGGGTVRLAAGEYTIAHFPEKISIANRDIILEKLDSEVDDVIFDGEDFSYEDDSQLFGVSAGTEGTGASGRVTFEARNITFKNFDNRTDDIGGDSVSNKNGTIINILNKATDITFSNCTFENNSSGKKGGVINYAYPNKSAANEEASMTITDCIFKDNEAVDNGGAISCNGSLKITGSTFENNTGSNGGAISCITELTWTTIKETTIEGCIFKSNISRGKLNTTSNKGNSGNGGAIFLNNKAHLALKQCYFTENIARRDAFGVSPAVAGVVGGAIFATLLETEFVLGANGEPNVPIGGTEVVIENSTFYANEGSDGIVYISKPKGQITAYTIAKATLTNLTFESNVFASDGADIQVAANNENNATSPYFANVELNNCLFGSGNTPGPFRNIKKNTASALSSTVVNNCVFTTAFLNTGDTEITYNNCLASETISFNNISEVLKFAENTAYQIGDPTKLTLSPGEDQLGATRTASGTGGPGNIPGIYVGAWEYQATAAVSTNEETTDSVVVYSNANGVIQVKGVANGAVSIHTILGEKIEGTVIKEGNDAVFYTKLNPGVYIARIVSNNINTAKKFIVQ